MNEPGFWDDQGRAAAVSSEHARTTRRVENYERLRREYEDARELADLDGDMADEISASVVPLRAELARLQEDALFDGEYDPGDAVHTVWEQAYSVQHTDAEGPLGTGSPHLVLAGEHTAGAWTGTMEGALRSGLRAAAQVRAIRGA